MRGKTHEHHHAAHMKHRAKGGNVEKSGIKKAGGNPYVEREAEEDKDGEVTERKRGGKTKHYVDGKKAKHRMDRAAGGRTALARGGRAHEKRDKEGEFEHKRARGGHVSGVEPDRGHSGVPKHHANGGTVRRARGGRTGSDTSPLSSANKISGPEPQPKTQQGGISK